jgi:hypothetical protein
VAIELAPLNDLSLLATIKEVNASTGALEAATTGTVTAFIALSSLPTATAADPALSVAGVHTANGVWLINFDGGTLTYALLNGLFASAAPFLIVTHSSGVRVYTELTYTPSRQATVV